MKLLVYAILRASELCQAPLPRGIDDHEVSLITDDALALAFSTVQADSIAPERGRLLAFAQVIADLGRERTILPVRFGTLLENEEQAKEMLQCKHNILAAALAEVDGCAEWTVRVLARFPDAPATPLSNAALEPGPSDGLSYMFQRRRHFIKQDHDRVLEEACVGRFRAAFEGLAIQCRPEWNDGPLGRYLALHFLVRRENLEHFRCAFRLMEKIESDPLLLTGPWVPYNFVNLGAGGLVP